MRHCIRVNLTHLVFFYSDFLESGKAELIAKLSRWPGNVNKKIKLQKQEAWIGVATCRDWVTKCSSSIFMLPKRLSPVPHMNRSLQFGATFHFRGDIRLHISKIERPQRHTQFQPYCTVGKPPFSTFQHNCHWICKHPNTFFDGLFL